MSQLCSIHHDFAATLYIPEAYMCSMVRVWPQLWQAGGGPRDKIWDFVALVWPIRRRIITTSSGFVRCGNFLGGPSVCFMGYRYLLCIDTSPLIWTSCWMYGLTSGCIVDSCQRVYVVVKGLLSWLVHYLITLNVTIAWYPAYANTSAVVTPCSEEVHDLANGRGFSIFALNCLQVRHWIKVDDIKYTIHT